jgi:hypothetical protein
VPKALQKRAERVVAASSGRAGYRPARRDRSPSARPSVGVDIARPPGQDDRSARKQQPAATLRAVALRSCGVRPADVCFHDCDNATRPDPTAASVYIYIPRGSYVGTVACSHPPGCEPEQAPRRSRVAGASPREAALLLPWRPLRAAPTPASSAGMHRCRARGETSGPRPQQQRGRSAGRLSPAGECTTPVGGTGGRVLCSWAASTARSWTTAPSRREPSRARRLAGFPDCSRASVSTSTGLPHSLSGVGVRSKGSAPLVRLRRGRLVRSTG